MARLSSIREHVSDYITQQSETDATARDTVYEAIPLFVEAVENKRTKMVEVIEGAYTKSDQALQEQVAKLRALLSSSGSTPSAVGNQVKESMNAIVLRSVAFRFTVYDVIKTLAKNLIVIPGACSSGEGGGGPEYLFEICETPEERMELVDFLKSHDVSSSSSPKEALSKLFEGIALKDVAVPVSAKTLSVIKKVNAIKKPAEKLSKAMELVESILSKQSAALQVLLEEIDGCVGSIIEMLSTRESAVVEVIEKKSIEEEERVEPYFARVEELIQRCIPFMEKEEEEEALRSEGKEVEEEGEEEESEESKAFEDEKGAVMEEVKSVIAEFSSMKSSGVIGVYSIEKDLIIGAFEACFQLQVVKLKNH